MLDALLMFSTPSAPQDLAVAAGTTPSTNIIDWGLIDGIPAEGAGANGRDMGIGDNPALKLLVQITEAFAGGTSLQVVLQGSIADANGDPAAWTSWWSSPVYALADLIAGRRLLDIDFPRPPAGVAIPRFTRLAYVTVGTMTAGEIVAGIVLDRPDQAYAGVNSGVQGGYPAGITVAN